MEITYVKWREGCTIYKNVNAQKVYDEILSIGESATPQQIVDKARDENTELHKCLEWEDSVAAEAWRRQQARQITYFLVIQEKEVPTDRPEYRVLYKAEEDDGYKPVQMIVKHEDSYNALLQRAWAELREFKTRYGHIKELREILDLIA